MRGLSAKQKEDFKAHLVRWQRKLNLDDWNILVSKKKASKGTMAEVVRELPGRIAEVYIGDSGWNKASDNLIEEVAVHELLHLFLHELVDFAKDPNTSADHLMSLEHRAITVLVPLLVNRTENGNA